MPSPMTKEPAPATAAGVPGRSSRNAAAPTNDYGLLVSHNKVPAGLRGLFERQLGRIHLPADRRLWPNPAYVRRHREVFAA